MKTCPKCKGKGCDFELCEDGLIAEAGDWIVDYKLIIEFSDHRKFFKTFEEAYSFEQALISEGNVEDTILMTYDELYGDE